jgi:S-adenosylmethionine uptake transporter
MHSNSVVFYRFAISTVTLLPFIKTFKTQFLYWHIVRGFLLTIAICMLVYSINNLPIYMITIASFSIPLFTTIFAKIFLRETIPLLRYCFISLGFAGVIITVNFSQFSIISFLPLALSVVLFSLLNIINKLLLQKGEDRFSLMLFSSFFSTMFSVIFLPGDWQIPSLHALFLLITLGLGANAIFFCILKSYSSQSISSIQYIWNFEFPLAITFSYLFFKESPSLYTLIGCTIIILANILSCHFEQKLQIET